MESNTQSITIDRFFKDFMPTLDKETFSQLEKNILENGCRDALVVWNGILIDGHNRYKICTKHDIPFNVINKEFNTIEEAVIWVISTQMSRRNLTPVQLSYFRGVHYRMEKKLVSNPEGNNQHSEVGLQNEDQPPKSKTADRLSEQYKVSKSTIERDGKIANALDSIGERSPVAKVKILAGDVQIEKRTLAETASASEDAIAEIARRIEAGTYERERPDITNVNPLNKVNIVYSKSGDDNIVHFSLSSDLPEGDDISDEVRAQWEMIINSIAGDYFRGLQNAAKSGSLPKLKNTLRAYIIQLEDFYRQL